MPPLRRLTAPSAAATAASSSSPSPSASASSSALTVTPFPPYEPPFTPIALTALQTLTNLSENNGRPTPIDKLCHAATQALNKLSETAADLADHVPYTDPADADADLDSDTESRQALLDELEVQARALVDQGKAANDIKEVLKLAVRDARDGREAARRGAEEAGLDAVVVAEDEGVVGGFRKRMAERSVHYDGLSMRAKYGTVAEYLQFRRMVWASQRGDANMPRVSTWFQHLEGSGRRGGRPSHAPDESDSDSDIEIAQERQSYQCPLTLRTFSEPYTSTVCPHSFEKEAIQDYIRRGARHQGVSCPVPGCSQKLTLATVRLDALLLRKVRSAAARERDRAAELVDGGGDSADEGMVDVDDADADAGGVEVKNERRRGGVIMKRGRGKVVALSDEDDD
ncbi:zinc-finger of the MIZ type in Nse subunit-domain-containing protein [Morchella snyderi]|nr:zinc-finger of the MIZ type in Nse subunit-domain-containing protein [Morchella snyderi]